MTISMHGNALALPSITPIASVNDPGYQLTVNVPSYPSGTSTLGISLSTANGYTDHANIAASGVTSWTFNIPANQGWIRVCVYSDASSDATCKTYDTTGADMSISLSPPSGDSNRYYVYPGNTYYIYPGIRHDYYFHLDRDHGYGGHDYDGGHWFGGHHDTGNIGNGGNQNGVIIISTTVVIMDMVDMIMTVVIGSVVIATPVILEMVATRMAVMLGTVGI